MTTSVAAPSTQARLLSLGTGVWHNATKLLVSSLLLITATQEHGVAAATVLAAGLQASALSGGVLVVSLRRCSPRFQLAVLGTLTSLAAVATVLGRSNQLAVTCGGLVAFGAAWAAWAVARAELLSPDADAVWLSRAVPAISIGQALGALALSVVLAIGSGSHEPVLLAAAAGWGIPALLCALLAGGRRPARGPAALPALAGSLRPVAAWRSWVLPALCVAPVTLAGVPLLVERAGAGWVPVLQVAVLGLSLVLERFVEAVSPRRLLAVAVPLAAGWLAFVATGTGGAAAGIAIVSLLLFGKFVEACCGVRMTAAMLAHATPADRSMRSMLSSSVRFGVGSLLGVAAASAPTVVTAGMAVLGTVAWARRGRPQG